MKRVLVFITAYDPYIGGAEVAVKNIVNRMTGREFDIVTARFSLANKARERLGNVRIYRVGFGFWGDKFLLPFFGFWLGRKLAKINNYSFIWAIQLSYGGIAAYWLKRAVSLLLLVTIQEGSSESRLRCGRWGMINFWSRRIVGSADYIQAISQHLKDYALSLGAKCPITVVPNGVEVRHCRVVRRHPELAEGSFKDSSQAQNDNEDSSQAQNDNEDSSQAQNDNEDSSQAQNDNTASLRAAAKQSLHKTRDDDVIFIHTGRLVEKNGVDILIKALTIIKQKEFKFRCLLVGDGRQADYLKKLASEVGVKNEIEFVGEVQPEKVADYLKQADIFIRPSRSEGLGNSFLEAMAAGLITIGVAIGGIVDFLKDGKTGYTISAVDSGLLAEKIEWILNNYDQARETAERGRQFVRENYSWERVVGEMEGIFNLLN